MIGRDEVFSRHTAIWGDDKQQALEEATVLVAGVGGLGSFVCQTLVRSGVGCLILVDGGIVDPPDLNRQILYTRADIGRFKVDIAAERLLAIHGLTTIVPLNQRISADTPLQHGLPPGKISGLVDCLDNYNSRFLLEQMLTEEMFLVHGGVQETYGQVTTILKNRTPSLKSLYANIENPEGPMAVCSQAVASISSLMSMEVLNNIWGLPRLNGSLLIVELSDFTFSKIALS